MRVLSGIILLVSIMSACSVEPEPIQYGSDACHACKMTLMDKKFGAELVTKKGKVYKFDDVNCMLNFFNSVENAHEEFKYKLVVDFMQPAKLVDASNAFYLKSREIKSPMSSQIAAFENQESMDALKQKWGGIYLVWGELVTQFK
jgi:copper chaperone NosL